MSPSRPLIAHVVHRFDVGGMENGIVNLINGMPGDFAEHAVIALTEVAPAFASRITKPGVRFLEMRKPPGQTLFMLPRFYRTLRGLAPDIFHTRNVATLETQLAAAAAGVPHRVHGEHGWDMGDLDGSNTSMMWLRRLMRPFVHHQIALSAPTHRYLVERVGVPTDKVTDICNGVDVNRFLPAASIAQARRQLADCPLPDGAFVVGAVGRLAAVKNVPMLIDAFGRVSRRNPAFASGAWLALVGDGPELQSVQASLRTHGVLERSWLAGARHDVPACLQTLDLLCLPSLAEGISNTILEAMSTGLPVIATDVGGNPELVSDGETGTLVRSNDVAALADAVEQYFTDATLRARHASAARDRAVTQFSLRVMIERYHAVYARLLMGRSQSQCAA